MEYIRKLGNLTSTLTFPYSLEEYIVSPNDTPPNGWTLQSGYEKKTKERVLVHRFSMRKSTSENISIARKNVSKCKTLHHPFILKYKYSEEDSEYITLVTEFAIPLEHYLNKIGLHNENELDDNVGYGLLCIMESLDFINATAKLQLANFSVSSVFVTQQLDWKISRFGCATDIGFKNSVHLFNNFTSGNGYVARLSDERTLMSNVDVWALGCFFYVVYNWKNRNKWLSNLDHSLLSRSDNIPTVAQKFYKKLLRFDSINLATEINQQKEYPGIFSNKTTIFRCQLQNLYAFRDDELVNFFYTHNQEVKHISPELGLYMLYPVLMNFYNFGKLLHIVQPAIICVIVNFLNSYTSPTNDNTATFKHVNHEQLKDTIYQLWTSTDRGTRMYLLKSTELLLNYLNDSKNIGKKIVANYVLGFTDSLLELRLESIRCVSVFVKFLPASECHNKLLPFVAKVFQETSTRSIELAFLDTFEKVAVDLKTDSFKIILSAINHKLNTLNKRPTRIIHDILEFFVRIHSHVDSTLLIGEVIPSVTQLLKCSNQLVKNDALNCVNTLILYISNTITNQTSSNPNSNDIYYDTENISLSNQQLANSNLTIFDIETPIKPSQTGGDCVPTTNDFNNKPELNPNSNCVDSKKQASVDLMGDSKASIESQAQIDAAISNGWGWDLDECDYNCTNLLTPSSSPSQSNKEVPNDTQSKLRPVSSKKSNGDDLWDDWGEF